MNDRAVVAPRGTATDATADSRHDRWARRLRFFAGGIVAAIAIALFVATIAAADSAAPADRIGGDYPAFYGAGRIAADGDWDNLYEFDR